MDGEALISMDGGLPFIMAFHGGSSGLALMMWPEVCFML
ncbi:putative membrane protein [Escherichia coli 2733950]|nr:putative membrane protein [Escherichia coli P0298942.15]END45565.1 putative membrane protein [Escherichia coli 2733950]END73146.1 putative membrane protein [Escherichia coli P0298942.3]